MLRSAGDGPQPGGWFFRPPVQGLAIGETAHADETVHALFPGGFLEPAADFVFLPLPLTDGGGAAQVPEIPAVGIVQVLGGVLVFLHEELEAEVIAGADGYGEEGQALGEAVRQGGELACPVLVLEGIGAELRLSGVAAGWAGAGLFRLPGFPSDGASGHGGVVQGVEREVGHGAEIGG